MKYKIALLFIATLSFSSLSAQKTPEREAIKSMCGCFEVKFEYAETFAHDTAYHTLAKPYRAAALEFVTLESETSSKLVLQHLLVINDSTVIKHWRQDWEFQPTQLFDFEGDRTWTTSATKPADVRGQWAQKVYEVDDSPRYSGAATWFMHDGKRIWENTADAPLPRREYTKRSDYQIMRRANRHEITDWGWLHEQNNEKIVRTEVGNRTLVEEKGRNTYKATDPARCAAAADWWQKNRAFWANVRAVWDDVLAHNQTITLARQVNGQYLGQALDELSAKPFQNDAEAQKSIRNTLGQFIQNPSTGSK